MFILKILFCKYAKYSSFESLITLKGILQYTILKYININSFSFTGFDYMRAHEGMKFSTFDYDNDTIDRKNCAALLRGGWWFKSCFNANLNGANHGTSAESISLNNHKSKVRDVRLRFVEMKIRASD